MEKKELKNLELNDDQLEQAGGINKLAVQNVYKVLMNYMSSYEKARYDSLSHLLGHEEGLPDSDEIMTMLRTAYPDLALDKELLMEILRGYYDR